MILIWAIDGLDGRYVHERQLIQGLNPDVLYQDLGGANALFTYRVWPAIWSGENGGRDDNEESARFEPSRDPIWDRYPAVVALAPWVDGLYSQHQDQFDPDYRESAGPRERIVEQFDGYWDVFIDSLEKQVEIVVLGTRLPDILGHMDQNEARIHRTIAEITKMVEKMVSHDEITDYVVVSDHGFDYERYGDEPSGVDAHSRCATLSSSFLPEYERMSEFIEGWTADLDEKLNEQQLKALGYTE